MQGMGSAVLLVAAFLLVAAGAVAVAARLYLISRPGQAGQDGLAAQPVEPPGA
jgi:hypothetical protein